MPHDKHGNKLQAGDLVLIVARVVTVYQTADDGYCNTTVETVEPMFPTNSPTTITLNTKQVEFYEGEEDILELIDADATQFPDLDINKESL